MSGRRSRGSTCEQGETAIQGTLNKDAATLLTISDMSVLETKVKVDETDVARITLGDSAVVQIDAFPDTTFSGACPRSRTARVKAAHGGRASPADQAIDYEVTIQLVNPPATTRPDFSATAKIITDTRKQALCRSRSSRSRCARIQSSRTRCGDARARRRPTKEVGKKDVEGVFVVGADNKVTFRPVKVGIAGEKYFEVAERPQGGEKIVGGTYQAIRELKDGTLASARRRPTTRRSPRQAKS